MGKGSRREVKEGGRKAGRGEHGVREGGRA